MSAAKVLAVALVVGNGATALVAKPIDPPDAAKKPHLTTPPAATPAPPQPIEINQPIVVTGSRIPRRNLTAISPITLLDDRDVKRQGAVLTENLLNDLPQVTPDQGVFLSATATGTATVDLRDLGASRTLVLVNGRRFMPGDPMDPAADINAIPSALIKRVEVLTGGASSVYGSDAVSGVVNFILDTRIQGLRIDGQNSFYQHNNSNASGIRPLLEAAGDPFPSGNTAGGGIRDINGAWGTSFLDNRGHVTVYAGYRKIEAVTSNERDFSSCTPVVNDPVLPAVCGGSNASAEGTFITQLGVFHLGQDQTLLPGPSFFNYAPVNYFQRPGTRTTAGGFADVEISPALDPYVEVMFMSDRSVAQIASSGDFGETRSVNCDNPLLSAQELSLLCSPENLVADDDGNPIPFVDPVTGTQYFRGIMILRRRDVEAGPRQDDLQHRNLRLLGGVKGDLGRGLTYDVSYIAGRVRLVDIRTNDVLTSRLDHALDVVTNPATGQPVCRTFLTGEDPSCLPWDVFALNAVTPGAAAYLTVPARLEGTVRQNVATAFMTAALDSWGIASPLATDAPSINFGLEYRKDSLSLNPDEHYQSADLAGLGQPILPFDGSTRVRELFAEVRLPLVSHHLVDDLTLEAGYRKSWHSDGIHHFSTDSYKLGADLTPVSGLRFRASLQRAVRAPNVQELFAPVFPSGINFDPCAGPAPSASQSQCASAGVSAAQYGHVPQNPFEDVEGDHAIVGGNPELLPEVARTRSIGAVLEPRILPGFSSTIDWFDIRLKGSIEEIGGDTIVTTCLVTGDPLFCNRIHRDANGTLWQSDSAFVDDTNANIGSLEVSGLDIGAAYSHSLKGLGSLNMGFNGTWSRRYIVDNGGLAIPYQCEGRYGGICGTPLPRWRHTAHVSWQPGHAFKILSLTLNWRHIGPVTADALDSNPELSRPLNPAAARIGAQDYFDLSALMTFGPRYALRLGVRNMFDRDPPILPNGDFGNCSFTCNGNTYPQLYDPLGRFIFAGFTLNL